MSIETFNKRISSWYLLSVSLLGWLCLASFIIAPPLDKSSHSKSNAYEANDELLLTGVDGPYLFKKRNKIREIRVISSETTYEIQEIEHHSNDINTFECFVENKDKDSFSFELKKKIKSPSSKYKQPEKILAISDIEGNFDAFYSLLISNGVMDESYNWTYGEGHLVLVGDFVDRGTNVTQCLWLIYRLEQEAEKAGGMVHFILGNHEVMNLLGQTEYVDKKYLALAHKLSGKEELEKAYKYLMSNQRELVRWMKSKNVIERIGKIIFVHGGLSRELITANMSIGEINNFMRLAIAREYFSDDSEANLKKFLMGPLGPLWYRGAVCRFKKIYTKASQKDIDVTLNYFQAKQMVIGHTVVKKVSCDFNGKVYRTDIGFPTTKFTGMAQGLLIEGDQFYRVNDLGERTSLTEEIPHSSLSKSTH